MNGKILQSLGLTEKESEIYLILLDTGSTTTGQIIKKSGLHKATVYSILQRLIDQGLVSYIVKENIRYFEAADPENLLDFLKEKEENLKEILPELKKRKESAKQKQKIMVFEGWKGMETVYGMLSNTLQKGETYYVFGASKGEDEKKTQIFFNKFVKKTSKKGVKQKVIFNETARGNIAEQYNYPDLYEAKHMPYTTPAEVGICRDKALITILEKTPTTILIDDKKVSDSFKNYFNLLWNQDVKIYRGFDDVTEKFWSMLDYLKPGDEYFVLGANYGFGGQKLKEWFTRYHSERVKRKIKAKLLSVSEAYQGALEHLTETGDPEMKYGEIKRLPPEFSSPMQINLYKGNKVLMFLWGKEDMVCFEIESALLYKNFKNYFDGLWNQEIKTVRGLEGVKGLFLETLNCGELRMIGARGYLLERVKGFYDYYNKKALETGVKWKNIVDIGAKGRPITKLPFAETKYVGKEFFTPVVIWLYNNKVVSVNWEGKEPIAFVVEDVMLYKNYMKQFDLLWNTETQTLRGFDVVWEHLQELAECGEEVYFIGARGYYFNRHPENLKKFEEALIKNKTTIKNIVDIGAKNKSIPYISIKNQEVRYVSNEFLNPNVIWIYNNKVAITQYVESEPGPILLIINNKNVYDAHKKQFDLLWKISKK